MPHSENITKPTLVSSTAGSTTTPDPFDLESLRLNPSFLETTGVKKLITTVPVRRPSPQDFVRVHPSPKYRDNFAVVDLKEDREDYLVRPEIIPDLANEIIYKTIYTAINRQYTNCRHSDKHTLWVLSLDFIPRMTPSRSRKSMQNS